MKMTEQEIQEAIEHQQKMLRVLRQRLQQRELQEAQYGINAPPEVISEIYALAERIRAHETELVQLRSLAAEDKLPLSEVEFRALLAEALDTSDGRPTIVGIAKLELARLRIGLKPERSQEIECEVRSSLAEETFYRIHRNMFNYVRTTRIFEFSSSNQKLYDSSNVISLDQNYIQIEYETILKLQQNRDQLVLLGRAIRLDASKTLKLFLSTIPSEPPKVISIALLRGLSIIEKLDDVITGKILPYQDSFKLKENLIEANNIWPEQSEISQFEQFIQELQTHLTARQQSDTTSEQVLKELEIAHGARWQSVTKGS
jgi:hypothetical protein